MFDRTTWIAIALSVAGLVGWQYYYSKTYAPYIAHQAEMQREQRLAKLNTQSPKPLPSPTPSATVLPI